MIISLSGLIGSGKDTVADYLVGERGFTRMSFAGTLKDAVAAIFGWDREMLEGKTPEARIQRDQIDIWWARRLEMSQLTPRWVLQHFGTECCRRHFHNDIWLASLEHQLLSLQGKDVVISDSRFKNELQMLRAHGATLVAVQRGKQPDWWKTAVAGNTGDEEAYMKMSVQSAVHPSEWDWAGFDFDVTIKNDGSLSNLYNRADDIIKNQERETRVSTVNSREEFLFRS